MKRNLSSPIPQPPPEFKEWLSEPTKLVQLIDAAEGATGTTAAAPAPEPTGGESKAEPMAPATPAELLFTLTEQETVEALRLLTKFGELGAARKPQPGRQRQA